KDGRVATLTTQNGLQCNAIQWVVDDDAGSFWLGTSCGLVRVARAEIDGWAAAVGRDRNAQRVVRVALFDSTEGVRTSFAFGFYREPAIRSSAGQLWFLSYDGVSVVDPRHLPVNTLPPPVQIEQVTADRTTYEARSGAGGQVRLPPLVRDLQIDYTALSLVTPEKNGFQIKLEGWDRDWRDVGTRRQAFYNNLPPRKYRFR